MNYFDQYLTSMDAVLRGTSFSSAEGGGLSQEDGILRLGSLIEELKAKQGRLFFCGNGASAAFASHMSLDWSKNGGVPCIPLLDLTHLTALGNDLGYEEVFSTPVGWHGRPEDVLVTISSSGNSPNIVRAIEAAKEVGMRVVTFSGLKPDNRSRAMGDFNIYVPAKTYGIVECAHQVLLHMWLDSTLGLKEWDREVVQNMNADEFQL